MVIELSISQFFIFAIMKIFDTSLIVYCYDLIVTVLYLIFIYCIFAAAAAAVVAPAIPIKTMIVFVIFFCVFIWYQCSLFFFFFLLDFYLLDRRIGDEKKL